MQLLSDRKKIITLALFLLLILAIPITLSVALKRQDIRQRASGNVTALGMQIDLNDDAKIPTPDQFVTLNPSWVRFVYRPNKPIPPLPAGAQSIVIFNNESVEPDPTPLESTDVNQWRTFVDTIYIPKLTTMLQQNPNISAVQIWNEEDLCNIGSYCPGMPEEAYAYMLSQAAAAVKSQNNNIKVIMGGLASGQVSYITAVKQANPQVFSQVDAVGIHPYGKSPDGWCTANCPQTLEFGDLAAMIAEYNTAVSPTSIWVTEVGYGTNDTSWQGEYLDRMYQVLKREQVPVMIWYAWIDTMTGANGQNNWGLVKDDGTIKAAGITFQSLTNSTLSPSHSVAPSLPQPIPIYRYRNPTLVSDMYTPSTTPPQDYVSEGVAFYAYPIGVPGTVPLYHYYHLSDSRSFDHYYGFEAPVNNELPGAPGYIYQDAPFYVFDAPGNNSQPVYRLYNVSLWHHFYTTNVQEANTYVSNGYVVEGGSIANNQGYFYVPNAPIPSITLTSIPSPSITPTETPNPTPSVSVAPTETPNPTPSAPITPTLSPINALLSFVVTLEGIGPNGGNTNPLHRERQIEVTILDQNEQEIATSLGNIVFSQTDNFFIGYAQFDQTQLADGNYYVKIKTNNYLRKRFSRLYTVAQGVATQLQPITLIVGDSNNDNLLNISDYNMLSACFGTKATSASCQNKDAVDFDDDGDVDGVDLNLLLRSLTKREGD